MRTVILIMLSILVTGCDVIVDKRFVTCYMSPTMESIYCIPDNQLPSRDECIPGTETHDACVTFKSKYTEFR